MLTSCAGVSPTRVIGDTAGAAGGALVGHGLSKGNPLITAAGAGAGVLLSETLQAESNASARKSYNESYEKGRSDSAKQRFQSLIDKQRLGSQSNDASSVRLLEVPLLEREENGVILAPMAAFFVDGTSWGDRGINNPIMAKLKFSWPSHLARHLVLFLRMRRRFPA
jgi:hypothetical protein